MESCHAFATPNGLIFDETNNLPLGLITSVHYRATLYWVTTNQSLRWQNIFQGIRHQHALIDRDLNRNQPTRTAMSPT